MTYNSREKSNAEMESVVFTERTASLLDTTVLPLWCWADSSQTKYYQFILWELEQSIIGIVWSTMCMCRQHMQTRVQTSDTWVHAVRCTCLPYTLMVTESQMLNLEGWVLEALAEFKRLTLENWSLKTGSSQATNKITCTTVHTTYVHMPLVTSSGFS